MKLTLETDNGKTNTVDCPKYPGDRLKTLQDMCILLDAWAEERDKQEEHED